MTAGKPIVILGVFVADNTSTGRPLTEALPARIVERFYAGPAAMPPQPSAWKGTWPTSIS